MGKKHVISWPVWRLCVYWSSKNTELYKLACGYEYKTAMQPLKCHWNEHRGRKRNYSSLNFWVQQTNKTNQLIMLISIKAPSTKGIICFLKVLGRSYCSPDQSQVYSVAFDCWQEMNGPTHQTVKTFVRICTCESAPWYMILSQK